MTKATGEVMLGESGFQGFRMQLPENCVEYMIFLIDSQVEPRKVLPSLEAVRKQAMQLADKFTSEYIWQRESFKLESKSHQGLLFLHGITDYGDCIQDEWLIVYLLRELTKARSDVWVRVSDGDGEFLLIEAAKVLPKWLSPETDSNRVWIHRGELRVIRLPSEKAGEKADSLSLPEAVDEIRAKPDDLVHLPLLEAEAFYRLENHPEQIVCSIHVAQATVPRKLAYILQLRPTSIAPATEAFYLRDATALKPFLSEKSLNFPPVDLVTMGVRFTRTLYAQLTSQRVSTPPAWTKLIKDAETVAETNAEETHKKLKRLSLGLKVTAGFEMLAAKAHTSSSRVAREVALLLEDLAEDGDAVLPDDREIANWKNVDRDDDDSWIDIGFEDLERVLDGKGTGENCQTGESSGFGDAKVQVDLRKIVSRFESFLNDERAGIDGAEWEEMDEHDDSEDDSSSENEDTGVSFDEEQFAAMMREITGISSDPVESSSSEKKWSGGRSMGQDMSVQAAREEEDGELRKVMEQMETELKEHGALNLDPIPGRRGALKGEPTYGEGSSQMQGTDGQDNESDGGEINVDYNLAKNLLESFKSQAGVAGPAGSLLSMMGLQLPRDESEHYEKRGE